MSAAAVPEGFVLTPGGAIWQTAPAGWSAWSSLGGTLTSLLPAIRLPSVAMSAVCSAPL